MMESEGALFLSRKTKPQAMRAKDGEFALTLLAFDRQGPHTVEAYRLIWSGIAAMTFWQTRAHELQPGAALVVELTRLRAFSGLGKHAGAEIHAHVNSLQLLTNAVNSPNKMHSSAYADCADSYQPCSE